MDADTWTDADDTAVRNETTFQHIAHHTHTELAAEARRRDRDRRLGILIAVFTAGAFWGFTVYAAWRALT